MKRVQAQKEMHTRQLMSMSAGFMALVGLAASFLPQEVLSSAGSNSTGLPVLVIQVVGAVYLGFAALNWAARGVLMGGIYGRPLAMGNFLHFAVAAIVLVKSLAANWWAPTAAMAIPYSAFAVWFGLVLFASPKEVAKSERR